ncbi:uncharacterized protein LOC117179519 isoform X2 [Belonocnema kinseyi]|uniref:uncharacterized protein LOC117179519 isoform X2 n=1 Tax=Belonocnema kinseyi TaxID=2817044 RepID=UPI00143DEB8F|nr:uncharacterized protein LOC117179519 isoform X2 [Belonocnema kinseyi]
MHHLFTMGCHDNSTMQLNFKGNSTEPSAETKIPQPVLSANGESLISSPRKYNISSLRIPADPSWPKIPQRKFADKVGDIIDQPCVVTVTGTPRRSRTIVRTPTSQTMRGTTSGETVDSSHYGSSNIPYSQPVTQPLKRRPGCIDPRFKRVTTVKSQMTSTEPQEHEHETPTETSRSAHVIPNQTKSTTEKVQHPVPEKDTNLKNVTQEEAEKLNEVQCTEGTGIQALVRDEDKELEKQKTDFRTSENCAKQSDKDQVQNFTQEVIESRNCDLLCNDSNLSEKCNFLGNSEDISGGTRMNKISQSQYCKIISSNSEACKKGETKSNKIISNDNQCQTSEKDVSPHKDISTDSQEKLYGRDEKLSEKNVEFYSFDKRENFKARKISPKHEINHFKCSERCRTFMNSKAENSECLIQSDEDSISLSEDEIYRNRCKEHNIADDKESYMPATTDSEYGEKDLLSRRKKKPFDYYNCAGDDSTFSAKDYQQMKFFQTHAECFHNSSKKIESSENEEKSGREKNEREKKERDIKFKEKMRSQQDLSHLNGRKFSQISEPHINIKQRRCSTSYSKNKLGYSEEKTDVTDSEFTFLWPERQRVRRKSSHGYSQKLMQEKRNRSCDSGRIDNSEKIEAVENDSESKKKSRVNVPHPTDLAEPKRSSCKKLYQAPPQDLNPVAVEIMKNQNIQIISPRADTDITTSKPKTIPVKTQQLLSKSYWEYYNKLKQVCNEGEDPQKQYFCQVAMGAPQIKKKRGDVKHYEDQSELSRPEMRTLERCSVLSSMINKTLDSTPQESMDTLHTDQIFLNTNMKSFSDPTAETPSVVINQAQSGNPLDVHEGSSISSKSVDTRTDTQVDNGVIKLKTIFFFGILMYAIIVFLPMMYDYFFYVEYDEYEDLTYIEIALDYIVSSFREAFNGVFDVINKIIFLPSTCRKCNSFA